MQIKRTLADGTEETFELTPTEVFHAWEEQERMETEINVRQRLTDMIESGSDKDIETIEKVLLDDDLINKCVRKTDEFRDNDTAILQRQWDRVVDAVRYVFEREGIVLDTY